MGAKQADASVLDPTKSMARKFAWCSLVTTSIVWFVILIVMVSLELGSLSIKRAIAPLQGKINPVACEPTDDHTGHLIHIDCPLRRLQTFSFPKSFRANRPDGFQGVFLDMQVEMYQNNFHGGFLRSKVTGVWSSHIISAPGGSWDSATGQANAPDYFPHIEGVGRRFSDTLYAGYFSIDRSYLTEFHAKKKIKLFDDDVYKPSHERPPTQVSSENTQVYKDSLYTGDPLKPQVGDLRITFYGGAATHVSAIGIQSGAVIFSKYDPATWIQLNPKERKLLPFSNPVSPVNGTTLLLREGDHNPKALLRAFEAQNDYCAPYLGSSRVALGCLTALLCWGVMRARRTDSSEQRPISTSAISSGLFALGLIFLLSGLFNMAYRPAMGALQVAASMALVAVGVLTDKHARIQNGNNYMPLTDGGVKRQETELRIGNRGMQHSHSGLVPLSSGHRNNGNPTRAPTYAPI